ncbi:MULTISPECIES: hypothetical protein [unclassified Enterococcus]|uniref:hypothetical protein n=1 Tax=unclassified Enterococcus TaxID=2608891 RepID=UPI003F2119F7
MNEKIQRLIEELAEECQKEDVALLCTIGDCATAKNSIVGNLVELGFLLAVQEKKINEVSPIDAEIVRKAGIAALKEDEQIHFKHTIDILSRPLRGEFQ